MCPRNSFPGDATKASGFRRMMHLLGGIKSSIIRPVTICLKNVYFVIPSAMFMCGTLLIPCVMFIPGAILIRVLMCLPVM